MIWFQRAIEIFAIPLVVCLSLGVSELFTSFSDPASEAECLEIEQRSFSCEIAANEPLSSPAAESKAPLMHYFLPPGAMPGRFSKPLKVGVIFYVNSIDRVNEGDGSYLASVDLTQTWKDPELAFDPREYGTFQREVTFRQADDFLLKNWTPQIEIGNLRGLPISREPCILIRADGQVTYTQRLKALFSMKYDLKPFPFDSQKLLVQLVSNRYNISEIEFYQSQFEIYKSGIRSSCSLPGWNVKDLSYSSDTFTGLDGKFYPEFDIGIHISRKAISHIFSFAPLLLIVIVPTILTLYANVDIGSRLTTWSGAILALIALSFTMQLRYPALPTNSILNQLVAVIFAYEFLMICITMSIFNPQIAAKMRNPYLIPEMKAFMRWQIPLVFIAIVVLIISITLVNT